MDFFRKTIFRRLRPYGALAPEIFTHARHWPRLASAHHKPGRGSIKNFKGEHLKLGLKFHICAPITLGVVGVTSQNFGGFGPYGAFLPGDVAHSCGDNVDTNFARGAPDEIGERKNVQNSARFVTTFDFDRKYLLNGSTYRK